MDRSRRLEGYIYRYIFKRVSEGQCDVIEQRDAKSLFCRYEVAMIQSLTVDPG